MRDVWSAQQSFNMRDILQDFCAIFSNLRYLKQGKKYIFGNHFICLVEYKNWLQYTILLGEYLKSN